MFIIFKHWRSSLELLSPTHIIRLIKQAFLTFLHGIKFLIRHFYWLLIIDLFIFSILIQTLLKTVSAQQSQPAITLSARTAYLLLLTQGVAFVISAILFLCMHKENDKSKAMDISHLKGIFPKYLQFYL